MRGALHGEPRSASALKIQIRTLPAREIKTPRLGDVLVWQFGRCYGHGAILVNREEVVHSYGAAKMCIVSRLDEPTLNSVAIRGKDYPRPVRYFDVWAARKAA